MAEDKIKLNNGKKGGVLEGKSHAEGGIKAVVVDDNRPIEVEGGEVIINKHAAKKHWRELSKINQSAGNGVPIHEPKFKKGGELEKGMKVEKEHSKTFEDLYKHKINKRQAIKKTVEDHLKENPKYYTELSKIEKDAKGNTLTAKQQKKFGKVMHEFKEGDLRSGSKHGKKVTDVKQAVAIAYSEARGVHEEGGNLKAKNKEVYKKWKQLVNMSYAELEKFYNSKEGHQAGLTKSEADDLGISNGRESAKWILKMKKTKVDDWTLPMWRWANKQISFISRMSGVKGDLYDEKGNKTRKHLALLIWGHNPNKNENGGGVTTYKNKYNKKFGYDKNESHNLSEISKDTGVSKKGLQQIYNKGVGAYNTNPQSVRPNVHSEEQWAMGRVYSAVMGGKAARIDAKELKMAKGGGVEHILGDYKFEEGGRIDGKKIKEQKARSVIEGKLGYPEMTADYLIETCGKFAIWFADAIKKDRRSVYGSNQEDNAYLMPTVVRAAYGGGIRIILDWLQHPLTPQQDLRSMTFDEAFDKANQFHDELKEGKGDINYVEPKENVIIKQYPEKEGTYYYWVFIPKSFCDVESRRMGHCGRTGTDALISLRSVKKLPNNVTISDSHVTIAVDLSEGKFYQVKGKANNKPNEKYRDYIFDLINTSFTYPIEGEYGFPKFNHERGYESETARGKEKLFQFKGFEKEYQTSEDFGWLDFTKEQIIEFCRYSSILYDDILGLCVLIYHGVNRISNSIKFDFLFTGFGRPYIDGVYVSPNDLEFYDDYRCGIDEKVSILESLNEVNTRRCVDSANDYLKAINKKPYITTDNIVEIYKEKSNDPLFDKVDNALMNTFYTSIRDQIVNDYEKEIVDRFSTIGEVKYYNGSEDQMLITVDLFSLPLRVGGFLNAETLIELISSGNIENQPNTISGREWIFRDLFTEDQIDRVDLTDIYLDNSYPSNRTINNCFEIY